MVFLPNSNAALAGDSFQVAICQRGELRVLKNTHEPR
jgi:hypothetical protein